jgi:hypothetical protein
MDRLGGWLRPPGEGRRQLAAILLAAAAVRALYLAAFLASPLYGFFRNDHRYYREWALRIAGGEWVGGGVFEQAPLYAYFLEAMSQFVALPLQSGIGHRVILIHERLSVRIFRRAFRQ